MEQNKNGKMLGIAKTRCNFLCMYLNMFVNVFISLLIVLYNLKG